MCELCGLAGRFHATSISERPGQLLGGLWWSGTFEEAGQGATRAVLSRVQEFSAQRKALWKSPIVALSRNDRSYGCEYFAGIAVEPGELLPQDFRNLDLPEMTLASSWHGPQDGDVVAHYSRMIDWLRGSGYSRDTTMFHHREEYPDEVDLSQAPTLRLMLPVSRDRD